ncbi:hypothetical protein RRG08_042330 [Elysia crispata]|uniref:C-type lectin domain-containing protein n=1 Tax=Elysia crispata TaxID=231223 RepID=A0AAE0ZLQ7_9GAST|nr:hypothetical protein RRG08_042330 [Elysia crispata]
MKIEAKTPSGSMNLMDGLESGYPRHFTGNTGLQFLKRLTAGLEKNLYFRLRNWNFTSDCEHGKLLLTAELGNRYSLRSWKTEGIAKMAAYPWSSQATHHVSIPCKFHGMDFYLRLLILAAGCTKCSGSFYWRESPQKTPPPPSKLTPAEGQCRSGWTQGDAFCYKVFDERTAKRVYLAAQQLCESRGAQLLSQDDVGDSAYTDKTFWVAEKKEDSCQSYKPKSNRLIEIDCKRKRTVVCKRSLSGVLKIDFFGIPGGSSISRGESLTLLCETCGYSTEHTSIAIGHSVADGDFADLIRGDPPMVELKHEEFRCEDAGEFVCEVRFHTTTAIRRRFIVTLRDCPLELCPLEDFTDGENSFTLALFEPLHFNVCFQSPSGTPPRVLGVVPEAGNDSTTSGATLRTSGPFQTSVSKKTGYSIRYSVEVKAEVIQPADLGLWKMSVGDGAAKDGQSPVFFSFRINAEDTVFLFRVVGVNPFNVDAVNSSACEEHTVTARTLAAHPEEYTKQAAETPGNSGFKISMLHIIIGVSLLAVIILITVLVIILISRKRGYYRNF